VLAFASEIKSLALSHGGKTYFTWWGVSPFLLSSYMSCRFSNCSSTGAWNLGQRKQVLAGLKVALR
jgi:hypothetical protein